MTARDTAAPRRVRPGPAPRAAAYQDLWEHLGDEIALMTAALGADGEDARDASALEQRRRTIDARAAQATRAGVDLPLVRLGHGLGLTGFELSVLVLCIAAQIDPERMRTAPGWDTAPAQPTIGLALRLLEDSVRARALGRAALGPAGPLARNGLVHVELAAGLGDAEQLLRVDERLRDAVTGSPLPARDPWSDLLPPSSPVPHAEEDRLVEVLAPQLLSEDREAAAVCVHAEDRACVRAAVEDACDVLGIPLLVIDVPALVASGCAFGPAVRAAMVEALLLRAIPFFEGVDTFLDGQMASGRRLRELAHCLEDVEWPAVLGMRRPMPSPVAAGLPWLTVAGAVPAVERLAERWRRAAAQHGLTMPEPDLTSLAARFPLPPSAAAGAVCTAVATSAIAGRGEMELDDIEAACRAHSAARLRGIAEPLTPRARLEDVVLPPEHHRQLREIVDAVVGRTVVLGKWQLEGTRSRGLALSALFAGPPGTGKTMAGEAIAGALALDLYVVDLSTVVSKYIGETEENLSRVFDAAETGGAVLFFDEADALFGRRGEVKDAHDRYANMQVSYLLQRLETYRGLVVLASNMRRNIDEAFLRRIAFLVDFPFPATAQRRLLWQRALPPAAPLDPDIDWTFLATRFELSGGSIASAVLRASYRAAARDRSITFPDLLHGVRRELEKAGRLPGAEDFVPYADFLGEEKDG